MAQPLLIANAHNASIEELKQVSRVGSNQTATRCTAVQMLLAGADRAVVCNALLVTNLALRKWINRFNRCGVDGLIVKKRKATKWHRWKPKYLPPYSPELNSIERIWLKMKATWFNNYVCKNEKKLSERLDQAILDVTNHPEKTQKTTYIGTLC